MIFSSALIAQANMLLDKARTKGRRIVTAESCTGGLIAGLLTEIPGSSDAVERGFVVYANRAKEEMLDVPHDMLASCGAVSKEVALAMATGALAHSQADISVAVTGIAGPSGGTAQKPVGLVYIASALKGGSGCCEEHRFGDIGRENVRLATVESALHLMIGRL